jgi:uncharacterized Zn-binding protein involved in type VI secretion
MSRPLIVVGDKTSHGGVVIQGSTTSDAGGKMIARVGDKVTCPVRGHGSVTVIVSGDPTFTADGQPVARHGDKTACGATLLSSQVVTYVDVGSNLASPAAASFAVNSTGTGTSTGSTSTGSTSTSPTSTSSTSASGKGESSTTKAAYDQHFALKDDLTGAPLSNRFYRIKWSGGVAEGRTDAAGLTQKVAASTAENATIEVFAEGHQ